MKNTNVKIDLDDKLVKYVEDKVNKNIDNDINQIVYLLLDHEKIYIDNVSVSIQVLSEEEIRNINKEYRGIDKSTDVLSFPIFEKQELDMLKQEKNNDKVIKELELGDIFICLEVVEEHAKEYETGIVREVLYMITHGMCHLLGYDHIEEEDKKVMRQIEEEILNKIGVVK